MKWKRFHRHSETETVKVKQAISIKQIDAVSIALYQNFMGYTRILTEKKIFIVDTVWSRRNIYIFTFWICLEVR